MQAPQPLYAPVEDDFDEEMEDEEEFDQQPSESGSESEQSEDSEPEQVLIEEETKAEQEIEGDFDRLVLDIRQRNDPSSMERDWDFKIQEQDAEFREDLRAASGIGRTRKNKSRSSGPVLSQQVKSLIGDGNQAYVDANIPETIRLMHEVIRIEPRAVSAWSVLAQCYSDMHQEEKALQLRIMAAHLRHDAEEWERLATQSRDLGLNQQALYCYRKLYSLDPTNVDALWDRAALAKELGDLRTARHAYLAILKRFPHDLTVLGELKTILIELSDLKTCATLFQNAFDHYQALYPTGHGPSPAQNGTEVDGGGFTTMEIMVLADLYGTLGDHESSIQAIKKGYRWLQGRVEQRYWDRCDDDREYDIPDAPNSRRLEEDAIKPGCHQLEVNARHRLAVARIKLGDIEEGKMHAEVILSQDVLDYTPLFGEIADAYFEREMYAEARPIYELLGTDACTSSLYVLLQTAACLRNLDELKDAAEVYEHVRMADPTDNETKLKLAEIYEILNEPRKALDLVYEVIDSRSRKNKDPNARATQDNDATSTLFSEGRPKTTSTSTSKTRLTHTQLRQLEAEKEKEVLRSYRRLVELRENMLVGEPEAFREWMLEAEKMVETFRETRALFSASRNVHFRGMFPRSYKKQKLHDEEDEERMASRLQLDLESDSLAKKAKRGSKIERVDVFRGVSFDEWLRIFMQYSFNLTKNAQFDLAEEILRHILLSNAYLTRDLQDTIRIALITVAIHAKNYTMVIEQCRKLTSVYQFNNEPLRLLLASLSSGLRPTDSFITSTFQKHIFREVKMADAAVTAPATLKWVSSNKRWAPVVAGKIGDMDLDGANDEEVDDGDPTTVDRPEIPTTHNPVIMTFYGQMCIAAKSYQSAIFYLLHSYDYCPDDPVICLSLAIASIGRAMQRQADNRHHLISQALAFLSQYRALRGLNYERLSEVEYNFGRTFHQLGLFSHAAKHYEKVLELAEKQVDKQQPGFAPEAAYNLSLIYVMTGATTLADAIYRRWLSM
ncbi:hypothetical protein C8J56DRAFT_926291 [Mycena floridula]|nr:hypothetical protein C8J56DRAFT_926291 [Mycena floridula]